jgi:nitrogen fixation protein
VKLREHAAGDIVYVPKVNDNAGSPIVYVYDNNSVGGYVMTAEEQSMAACIIKLK